MANLCYIIHSKKIIFKTEPLLQLFMIEELAGECYNKRGLNKMMTRYFKDNVSVSNAIEMLMCITNDQYKLVDCNELGTV